MDRVEFERRVRETFERWFADVGYPAEAVTEIMTAHDEAVEVALIEHEQTLIDSSDDFTPNGTTLA